MHKRYVAPFPACLTLAAPAGAAALARLVCAFAFTAVGLLTNARRA